MLTNMATSAVIWSSGDLIQQSLFPVDKSKGTTGAAAASSLALTRSTLATGIFGGIFVGTTGTLWYRSIDTHAAKLFRINTPAFIAYKILLDTVLYGPLYVAAFFMYSDLTSGGTLASAIKCAQKETLPVLLAEIVFWPPYQAFNFSKVPVRHHLNVVNFGCLLDSTFLCWARQQTDWFGDLAKRLGVTRDDDNRKKN